ncbi:MAG: hypothetical protein US67_C0046G0001 [Candidatus Woesebacteria bacterium GW2011_GWD1_38_10]|uniref:Uncharacterized protein n=1 Tax=Candidatus Woesebacteria bacterium GW2011_GWD1_38_10 TaxID=1618592 RepID=A0A0G0HZM3_9BACT|nr:MAG: hypothetical protein US67_C0046G0001 [Candidatus Woesebacteria bacterium GW2011_GWD1_38_10]
MNEVNFTLVYRVMNEVNFTRPHRLAARTAGFHPVNPGSIPGEVTLRQAHCFQILSLLKFSTG